MFTNLFLKGQPRRFFAPCVYNREILENSTQLWNRIRHFLKPPVKKTQKPLYIFSIYNKPEENFFSYIIHVMKVKQYQSIQRPERYIDDHNTVQRMEFFKKFKKIKLKKIEIEEER